MTVAHRSLPNSSDDVAPEADAYLAILLVLYSELTRVVILTALNACIANALAARVPAVDWRRLVKWYPRLPAPLLIASQRITRFWPDTHVAHALSQFLSALDLRNKATISYLGGDRANAACLERLAGAHREACASARSALSTLKRELSARALTRTLTSNEPLRVLLGEAIAGRWPGLNEDGTMEFPAWGERRRHQRVDVNTPADLMVRNSVVPTMVRNISLTGVGIDLPDGIRLYHGQTVTLRLENSAYIQSSVVWQQGTSAALRFHQPLVRNDPRLKFCNAAMPGEDAAQPAPETTAVSRHASPSRPDLFDIAD